MHRNALIYQRKFFRTMLEIRTAIRQIFLLMISKGIRAIQTRRGFSDYRQRSVDFSDLIDDATRMRQREKYRQSIARSLAVRHLASQPEQPTVPDSKRTLAPSLPNETHYSPRSARSFCSMPAESMPFSSVVVTRIPASPSPSSSGNTP